MALEIHIAGTMKSKIPKVEAIVLRPPGGDGARRIYIPRKDCVVKLILPGGSNDHVEMFEVSFDDACRDEYSHRQHGWVATDDF